MLQDFSLVQHMLTDPGVDLHPRKMDASWLYEKKSRLNTAGFNPYLGEVYYPAKSAFADWLRNLEADLRTLNEGDFLMKEVFFAVHDYLHTWSSQAIRAYAPEHDFGFGRLDADNLEDMVYLWLLTEAAATIGADYWFLSRLDIQKELDIGTRFTTLTTSFHINDLPEFRRFSAEFEPLSVEFFKTIASFYMHGEFAGFELADLQRSPKLLGWLEHELTYAELQRQYARQWFETLVYGEVRSSTKDLRRPVDMGPSWRVDLMEELGGALYQKSVEGQMLSFADQRQPRERCWTLSALEQPDFRFVNLHSLGELSLDTLGDIHDASWGFYFDQFVTQHDFHHFDPILMRLLPSLRELKDPQLLHHILRDQPKLEQHDEGHLSIFLQG